jgi:hypothetical protein
MEMIAVQYLPDCWGYAFRNLQAETSLNKLVLESKRRAYAS